MIQIVKPAAPEILITKGARRRGTHCANYTRYASDYNSGRKTFRFANEIYGHASVWEKLRLAQHKKCCYCECEVGNGGDVDHFRPRGASCQTENSPDLRPGYYWLAYEWDNLLLSCKDCNQTFKKSQFPLIRPDDRARTHHDDLSREQPLLIHPCHVDPEEYIGFRGTRPYAIEGNQQGEASIKVFGLDRTDLEDALLKHLSILRYMKNVVQQEKRLTESQEGRALIVEAKAILRFAITDEAKFASAARNAIATDFRYLPSELADEQV